MEDLQIVKLFWRRDEAAIKNSALKYGRLLHRISFNILSNREDSEECVNDTYLNAWSSIPPQKPDSLLAFLGRITRNLSLNRWRENRAQKRGGGQTELLLSELSDCIPDFHGPEAVMEAKFLTEAITRWLGSLTPKDRILFLRRYWFGDSLKLIADDPDYKTTPNKLAGHMFRLRSSLKNFLEKEEIFL